jgi:hypothetical protein
MCTDIGYHFIHLTMNWQIWGRTGDSNNTVELVSREIPLTPVRVASVFADRSDVDRTFVDDGQTQLLDKERQEVAIEAGSGMPDDGVTYFEQIQAPAGWIKLGKT